MTPDPRDLAFVWPLRRPGSRCCGSLCHCPEAGTQLSDFASRSPTALSVRGDHDPGLRRVARKSSGQGGK